MTDNQAFLFLDSSLCVTQGVQLTVMNDYAEKNLLSITFYGAEMYGHEHRHQILQSYINKKRCSNFIFFSLDQFLTLNGLDILLLKKIINAHVGLHFAVQKLANLREDMLEDLFLLSLSLPQFSTRPPLVND